MRLEQKWQRHATTALGYRCGIITIGMVYQSLLTWCNSMDGGKYHWRYDRPKVPVVELHAVNSRGKTGTARIDIPIEDIPEVIRNLQMIYDGRHELKENTNGI